MVIQVVIVLRDPGWSLDAGLPSSAPSAGPGGVLEENRGENQGLLAISQIQRGTLLQKSKLNFVVSALHNRRCDSCHREEEEQQEEGPDEQAQE